MIPAQRKAFYYDNNWQYKINRTPISYLDGRFSAINDGTVMSKMENKNLSRSQYFDGQSGLRKHHQPKKPQKKNQNVICDGRGHGPGGSNQEHGYQLFNNRSLSVLSTMHHLNPHRKVAMSPEILREAEEQASSLRKAVKQLQEQLEKTNREKARIHRFLSDLLYTLNARGYESVRDHEGTLVDLNKCKGETYLDLKGRDLKQRVNVRRQGGQEFILKAVIGNQERVIQSLVYKLDSIGRDIVLGNRLTMDDNSIESNTNESNKTASLETEILQLVNLIEGACQRCPEMYPALRDHYYLSEGCDSSSDLSPRNPVLHNLLNKCEQIAGEAQSRQLVEMLSSVTRSSTKSVLPRTQQHIPTNGNGTSKSAKNKQANKLKSGTGKAPRAVSSEILCNNNANNSTRPKYDTPSSTPQRNSSDSILKPVNGGRSENSFPHKGISLRLPISCPPGSGCPPEAMLPTNSGDEPTPPSLYSNGSNPILDPFLSECSVTVCPFCHRQFGIEESISEIKSHIEMHVFAGDTSLS